MEQKAIKERLNTKMNKHTLIRIASLKDLAIIFFKANMPPTNTDIIVSILLIVFRALGIF